MAVRLKLMKVFEAAFLTSKAKVLMLQQIFEANFFSSINISSNNYNKT